MSCISHRRSRLRSDIGPSTRSCFTSPRVKAGQLLLWATPEVGIGKAGDVQFQVGLARDWRGLDLRGAFSTLGRRSLGLVLTGGGQLRPILVIVF